MSSLDPKGFTVRISARGPDAGRLAVVELGRVGAGDHRSVVYLTDQPICDNRGEAIVAVMNLAEDEFDREYSSTANLSMLELASIYGRYTKRLSSSPAAQKVFDLLVQLGQSERPANQNATTSHRPARNAAAQGQQALVLYDADPVPEAKHETAPSVELPVSRSPMADAYRRLLMMRGRDGLARYTDDEIQERVERQFPNAKRAYVRWYRRDLKQHNFDPPAPRLPRRRA